MSDKHTGAPEHEESTPRVLLLDDDPFMLSVMTASLKAAGVEGVEPFTRGQDALEALDRGPSCGAEVLICDLQMPEMDGPELLRSLGERGFEGGVILISGESQQILRICERLGRAHGLRLLGALEKPLDGAAVKTLLHNFHNNSQRRRSFAPRPSVDPEALRKALRNGEILPHYQPKVCARSGQLTGVEALARWQHPERGLLSPFFFLDHIEALDLMGVLVERILSDALEQLKGWRAEGLDVKVSVNVDADTLTRLDLPERISGLLRSAGVGEGALTLEITESGAVQDIKATLETLTRLSLKGVQLSIDDFGTGYASLEQLSRLPFTELKIDRLFVHGAERDSSLRAILETSLALAQRLGMSTVAEGVEDLEDWRLIQRLGCDVVQGYFVGKPMPGEGLSGWLEAWDARRAGEQLKAEG